MGSGANVEVTPVADKVEGGEETPAAVASSRRRDIREASRASRRS